MMLERFACGTSCLLGAMACGDAVAHDVPEGTHHGYVVSAVAVPTTDTQATQFGFDLGGKNSSQLDGVIDNSLGHALAALAGFGFDIQSTITAAVDTGSILLLVDFQTKDFTASNAVGFGVKAGANAMPAPCSSSTDTVCRHHLNGAGTFSIAASSPTDAVVVGSIASDTFTGGPDDLTLQVAIGEPTPIVLDLLRARVQATSLNEIGIMSATLGGVITVDELNTRLAPAIAAAIDAVIERDCPVPAGGARVPPDCGCQGDALTSIHAFDGKAPGSAQDCKVTTDEILGVSFVATLLRPDACSLDSCSKADAFSIGIRMQAVKATFPM